ncbi:MAG: glutamate 5-kinase [Gammaproteobacteria bacterium]
MRGRLARSRRWVVKVGSALATREGVGLNLEAIEGWAHQMVALQQAGHQVVVVTSGSVAEGAARLGWTTRPHQLNQLQAAAAIGQMGLVRGWNQAYEKFGRRAAQILLTHEDLSDRQRYLNARSTLWTLLELGVFPVINENDTVATAEISLGDNDTLAGLVSNLIEADLLVLLTDQAGLMSADPRHDPAAQLIDYALVDDPALEAIAGGGGAWGRGGMRTKLRAARLAARSATSTIIASGRLDDVLGAIGRGETVGTLLHSTREKVAARKQWLGGSIRPRGRLWLDAGACAALTAQGKSLLAVGVQAIEGEFSRGELVMLHGPDGRELGRGLANYSAAECQRIKGLASGQIEQVLGYIREPELIHRDNLLLDTHV